MRLLFTDHALAYPDPSRTRRAAAVPALGG